MAPLHWPMVTPVEIEGGTVRELSDLFEHAERSINGFLRRALEANYLPSGVRLLLLPTVAPQKLKLDLKIPALTRGPRDETWERIVWQMAQAATWNERNRTSYFRRFLQEYHGPRGSVAFFHAKDADQQISLPAIHLLQYAYKHGEKSVNAPASSDAPAIPDHAISGDQSFPEVSLGELTVNVKEWQAFSDQQRPEVEFVPSFATDNEHDRQSVERLAQEIASDSEYLARIAPLASLGTVILAAPRQFHLAANLHKQLGTAGLNLVVEPHIPITSDLLLRCYLLADRLCTLFFTTTSYVQLREDTAASETFQMMAHSLGNALTYLPPGNQRIESVIFVEEAHLRAARWLHAVKQPDKSRLVDWGSPGKKKKPFEETLKAATFTPPQEDFTVEASLLHGREVDPRLFALIIELARNLQNHSKNGKGSLTIVHSRDAECCEIEITSDCDFTCARDLKRAIELRSNNQPGERGLDFVWRLVEKLSGGNASCIYTVGQKPFISTASLDASPKVILNVGDNVTRHLNLPETQRDTDVPFAFRCLVTSVRIEPSTTQ